MNNHIMPSPEEAIFVSDQQKEQADNVIRICREILRDGRFDLGWDKEGRLCARLRTQFHPNHKLPVDKKVFYLIEKYFVEQTSWMEIRFDWFNNDKSMFQICLYPF